MKRLFFFIVFSFLLMSGCTRQEMDSPVQDVHLQGRTMFHASFGDMQTRVHVEGGQALEWTDGDCITVFNLNSGNSMFRLAGITETGRAQFEVISATEGPEAIGLSYAVYPYDETHCIDASTGMLTVELPAVQHYMEDSFGLQANTMVAVTE